MPTVTFPNGPSTPNAIFGYMDIVVFDGAFTSISATEIIKVYGPLSITITGTGMTTSSVSGNDVVTGGTIQTITVTDASKGANPVCIISDLNLSGIVIGDAAFAEIANIDAAAVEKVLVELDWTYMGTASQDILLKETYSVDNYKINLAGDDVAYLGGGRDKLYFGDGNDLGYGGGARDVLWGAAGSDTLYGNGGKDKLFGGAGADKLVGGGGHDTLNGGGGKDLIKGGNGFDQIVGGKGNDDLYGGAGNDHFVFDDQSGHDTIHDWVHGEDNFGIDTSETITDEQIGDNIVLEWGDNSLTIVDYFT